MISLSSEFFGLILADKADRSAFFFFNHIGICVFTPFNLRLLTCQVILLWGVDLTKAYISSD